MRQLIRNVLCFFTMLIALYGCSDDGSEKEDINTAEYYEFMDADSKEIVRLSLQRMYDEVQLNIENVANRQSMLRSDCVKIIAFFPKDCSLCMPTFIHINNLLQRMDNLQVFIVSEQTSKSSSYRDFPITLSTSLVNLVDTNSKFGLFSDSLKRMLNIEIRDYKAPLFILQNMQNDITQSIEGVVLEEIFEQAITTLLAQNEN